MSFGSSEALNVSKSFISELSKLKLVPRSGWLSHGVGLLDVESVADHTFSTCALAMLLADMEVEHGERVDVEKVLRMAVLHDLAEALTFDISKSYLDYLGRRGEAIKREVEEAAWSYMVQGIRSPSIRAKYSRSQQEFNAKKSLEAQIVQAADKLDILFQTIAYVRRGYPKRMLSDLWLSTNRSLADSEIASLNELRKIAAALYGLSG
jgi:putative hydrolase of HD superfamily